jgi:hypothetical protein
MNFQKNYAQIIEHIQLPPTPSIWPPKNTPKREENTP